MAKASDAMTNLNRSKTFNTPQARTLCKLCPEFVLVGQPAQFIPDPPGLSHTACIEARDRAATESDAGGPP